MPNKAAGRSRAGYGNSVKIIRRKSRSLSVRSQLRSICGRTASMSWSYFTPDGQAVTQAMQPRHASKLATNCSSIGTSPAVPIFMR